MKKVLLIILGIILGLIIAGVLVLGYLGFVPGLSSLFGSDKPRDLGVVYTSEDYSAAHAKTGVEISSLYGVISDKGSLVLDGSHPANLTLSSQELTAVINNNSGNWKYFPVSNVQVKIGENGSAEMSGVLHFDRLAGYAAATGANYADIKTAMDALKILPDALPFYIAAAPTVTNNTASMNISKVEFGRFPVPSNYFTDYAGPINGFFTQQLNAFPGFSAKSASFNGGKLNFDGTLSNKVTTYK